MTAMLLFLLLVGEVRGSEKMPADLAVMQGTWTVKSAELSGKPFPLEMQKTISLRIEQDQYVVTINGKVDRGTVKLDPGKKPKSMDLVGAEGPNTGKTIVTIYEIKEDELKVCYNLKGDVRPEAFKSNPGSLQFLVTYERKKM